MGRTTNNGRPGLSVGHDRYLERRNDTAPDIAALVLIGERVRAGDATPSESKRWHAQVNQLDSHDRRWVLDTVRERRERAVTPRTFTEEQVRDIVRSELRALLDGGGRQ